MNELQEQLVNLRSRVAQNARQQRQKEVLAAIDRAIETGNRLDAIKAIQMVGDN